MPRYRLDDLGWYQFEQFCQSMLQTRLGLSVESWGGSGDLGRDAYSEEKLRFPEPLVPADGPFIFQAKFVSGANASGARPHNAIKKACNAELKRIAERREQGVWEEPSHYALLTNAPFGSKSRSSIRNLLEENLPETTITLLGGNELTAMLDSEPELRRSFPEIMGIRDIDALISESVNKEVLERSEIAIDECRDLIPVFVPTTSYYEAWNRLETYHFVVCWTGPPEMGKTAIARTISFAQFLKNWDLIDCRNPDDFFRSFDSNRSQVFIADDAFGRTEYDPTLGRAWERDLPKALRRIKRISLAGLDNPKTHTSQRPTRNGFDGKSPNLSNASGSGCTSRCNVQGRTRKNIISTLQSRPLK